MATLIGSLLISLGLDSGAFKSGLTASEKQLKQAQRRIEATGKSMAGFGQKMSLAVTLPLIALGKTAITAALESRAALGQVDAALKSMGGAAGRTREQLQGLATGIMRKSLFDDDEILRKVTANLLTFGNVAAGEFERAQQAAVDLAARMGTDLQSATILVGKALNDPAKGLAALGRAGIQFTAQQKDQIKAMAAVGNAAGAQRLMLAELEKQFAGSAAAARAADPFAAMQQSFADFQEGVGEQLLKAMPAITGAVTRLFEAFNTLSPGMQQAVVIGGGLAAVFGPLLMVIGSAVTAMAPFIAVIASLGASGGVLVAAKAALIGLGAALGPILIPLAAIAGVAGLIYANWERIAPVLEQLWSAIQATLGPPLSALAEQARAAFDEIVGSALVQNLIAFAEIVGNVGLVLLKAFGGAIPGIVRALGGVITGALGVVIDALRVVVAVLSGDWQGAWDAAMSLARNFVGIFTSLFGGLAQAVIGFVGGMVQGIKDWLGNKLTAIFEGVRAKIDAVKDWFREMYVAVVGNSYVPDMVDGISAEFDRLDGAMVGKAKKATDKTKAAFEKLRDDLKPLMERLFPEVVAARTYASESATIAAGIKDPALRDEALKRLDYEKMGLDPSGKTATQTIYDDIEPLEPQIDKIDAALGLLKRKSEIATVAIAKTFKDMADETIDALQSLTSAIKGGGFLDILGAVVKLGLNLGGIGAFGKTVADRINTTKNPPIAGARARGGPVVGGSSYLVGERGAELFTPSMSGRIIANDQLGGGGSRIQVVPSPYFNVVVDGRIVGASPAIMSGGAQVAAQRGARAQARRLA